MSSIVAVCLTGIVAAGAGGCRSNAPTTSKPVPVPAGGFLAQWRAPIELPSGDSLQHMYLRDDTVYVTTKSNHAYALAASGGQITQGYALPKTASSIQPPYVTKDYVVFPCSSTLQVYNRAGKLIRAIEIGHNVRSPLAGTGNYVYAGLDFPNGARLAKIDLNKEYANTRWELLTGAGVSAAPAYWQPQTAVFAGAEDGTVYAINEERAPIWSLPKNVFKTDGRILGDLKVDDFGLYVASTDSKLYCLDRATGKIKWQYYASSGLTVSP